MGRRYYYPDRMEFRPGAPPDWRWQRARWLVEHGKYFVRTRDDGLTGRAVEFLRALRRGPTERQLAKLEARMPDIVHAHRLADAPGQLRLEVEARLLAGQPTEKIAERTGVTPGAIDSYAGLFFDVAGRLDATLHIWFVVIGWPARLGPSSVSMPMLVKALSYRQPAFVDAWSRHLKDAAHDESDLSPEAKKLKSSVELLHKVLTLPNDPGTQRKLLKTYPIVLEIARKSAPARPVRGVFGSITAGILRDFAWKPPDRFDLEQAVLPCDLNTGKVA